MSALVATFAVWGCSGGDGDFAASALKECSCQPDAAASAHCLIEDSPSCVISDADTRYVVRRSEIFVTGGLADFDVGETSLVTISDGEATRFVIGDSSAIVDGGTIVHGYLGPSTDFSVSGGVVGALEVAEATVSIGGGTVYDLSSTSASSVSVYEGMVARMELQGTASVKVDGGRVTELDLGGDSRGNVTNGAIDLALVDHDARLTVAGGELDDLVATGHGEVRLSGGTVESVTADELARIVVSGGGIRRILALETGGQVQEARITVIGSQFELPFGSIEGVQSLHLSGILADGEAIEADVVLQGRAVLELCDASSDPCQALLDD